MTIIREESLIRLPSHFGERILTRFERMLKRKIVLETGAFLVEQKEDLYKGVSPVRMGDFGYEGNC